MSTNNLPFVFLFLTIGFAAFLLGTERVLTWLAAKRAAARPADPGSGHNAEA